MQLFKFNFLKYSAAIKENNEEMKKKSDKKKKDKRDREK